ncbi:MAG: alpha/beta hydrolase [Calditrichae bacterium]|nr:alpha/beta hydrolase [Calditrichia bacterium]
MIRNIFFVLIMLLACLHAGEKHFTIKNTEYISLKSEQTQRDYELIVYLPQDYSEQKDRHYPVLYFMDAYWDMPLLVSIYGQLVYDKAIPEMIMVGFSYPGDNVDYGALRSRDLTPTKDKLKYPNSGDGPAFLKFIEETVIPEIESVYRVDPEQRALSGSSFGGLFILYAMYEKPDLFKRYIAISPATDWDDNYLFKRDATYAARNNILDVRLFLSYGTAEYKPFREPIVDFQKQISERSYKSFKLLNYAIEGERHAGVKSEGYSRGLRWVFKDIAPAGPSGLESEIKNER